MQKFIRTLPESFDMRAESILYIQKEQKNGVWPLNVFAPWPRINYAAYTIKCLPFGAENCAIGVRPWLLDGEEPRPPPHKRKDLAAGAERASSQLSCDYLSSRMDARMDHVAYVTPSAKNTSRRRCRLRPLLI